MISTAVFEISTAVFDAYIFVLAAFIGFQVISKIPSVLHTPLMSATNAIHGVVLIGAILLAASAHGWLSITISGLAVLLGTINVVGGFVVTDRILGMFRRAPVPKVSLPEAPNHE